MSSRREDKRKRIIDAAVDVFADKGFFQAKVSEIAEAAGVADGTIYLYFKSKDDLLISLFREKMNEILQRFSAIRDEGSPEQQLRRYIAEHLAFVAEKPKLMQVLTVEIRQSPRFMKEATPQAFGRYLAVLAGIIDRGQASGAFRKNLDPVLISRALFGLIDEISLSFVLSNENEWARRDSTEVANQLADFILRGIAS